MQNPTPDTKNELKWITDLNLRDKTVIFLGENIGERLHDLRWPKNFLDIKKYNA